MGLLDVLGTIGQNGVNFGAAYDKYINGNQAANVLPGVNAVKANNQINPVFGWAPALVRDSTGARPKTANDGETGDGSGGGGGGGGNGIATTYNTAPNYEQINANTIAQLGQSAGTIQNALNRLPGQFDIARANIGTQFGQRDNELNTQRATNENSFNTSTTQNQQNFRTNKNVINDQASTGLRGLMRLLGSYGAVGSDMGLAGRAVSDQASAQNSGAGQTYSQNQSTLDTNWGNYRNQFDNEKKKLTDWRDDQLRGTEAQSTTTRQDLLSRLADINGQMSAARGGSYASSAQPYLDQANALSGRIDELGRLNPTYTGNTPIYEAASLGSYDTGNGAGIGTSPGAGGGGNMPFLSMLLNREKRQSQFGN